MYIKTALLISICLQIIAAILAINLTKAAKYNKSWILLTLALLLMASRRLIEYFPYIYKDITEEISLINSWIGVTISFLITAGFIYIRRIFNMIKRAEASRLLIERKILNAIIKTEENERTRFAKDLHDGLGPILSNIKMSLSTLEHFENKNDVEDIISNMKTITNEALVSIKEISNNLSPHVLENFGLIKAIENFAEKTEIFGEVTIQIKSDIEDIRFSHNIEIILYRVICELINNTLKHANAKNIKINVFRKNDYLNIKYTDDGIGINLKDEYPGNLGMGMSNIVSRIKSLNGEINFVTKPGKGFSAYIQCHVK